MHNVQRFKTKRMYPKAADWAKRTRNGFWSGENCSILASFHQRSFPMRKIIIWNVSKANFPMKCETTKFLHKSNPQQKEN